jgi:hypothetical protein
MAAAEQTFVRPYRTWGMRLFNGIGRRLRRWGFRPRLTLENILHTATRWSRLDDWGDDRFHEPLRVLLESFEEDAQLTPLGRFIIRMTCTKFAVNRLHLQDAFKKHPEILAQDVPRPVFIVGLPRTGTTLLHKLLCQDAGARPLLFWETLEPQLPAQRANGQEDPRARKAQRMVNIMNRWFAPQLPTVHALNPVGPEECNFLLFNTFVSPSFYLYGNVRSYNGWLRGVLSEDRMRVYVEYRRQLQLLQWGEPARHWVLKAPVHSYALEALLTLFPDAAVIQTHRDLTKVIPSTCSLFAVTQQICSDDVDCRRLGPEIAQFLSSFILEPAMKARSSHPGRVFDVHYRDLTRDPIGKVREIYQYFGRAMDDAIEGRMRQWIADNPPTRHGVHHYDLDQFGLTTGQLEKLFGGYREQFHISSDSR